MERSVIEVRSVDKKFGDFAALKGVSLTCERGKIYGLTGRNGSGKTVLLKCICGFLIPDAGEIRIFGKTKKRGEMLREAGIIIEEPAFLGKKSGMKRRHGGQFRIFRGIRQPFSADSRNALSYACQCRHGTAAQQQKDFRINQSDMTFQKRQKKGNFLFGGFSVCGGMPRQDVGNINVFPT